MRWEDSLATSNNTANGVIVTLKFKIADNCTEDSIPLTLNMSQNEVYDKALSLKTCVAVNGAIEVGQSLIGDVNDDGTVNSVDVTLLRRKLAGWPNVTINATAADVNRDGEINIMDVVEIARKIQ